MVDMPGRLLRGALGGIIAGAVFIGVTMWFAASNGNPAVMPFALISTEILGPQAVPQGTASVPLGILIHFVQSAVFGMIFALFVGKMLTNGTVALAATVYGLLLFLVNFVVLAQVVPQFMAFTNVNYPFELFSHMVYGTLLGFAFYGSGVREPEHSTSFSPQRPQTS